MNKIRYDFDQAIRQICQIRKLQEDARNCLEQAKRARVELVDLGDGEIVRLLTEAMDERIRQGALLCDRLEQLENALRKNLARFEETEEELARKIQGIGDEKGIYRFHDDNPMIYRPECLIGELRFTDVLYPDFLSKAAENYFASTL